MPQKKDDDLHLTDEENQQVTLLFAHYQHLAEHIQSSTEIQQVTTALQAIDTAPLTVQLAFLKQIAQEKIPAAADIAEALYTYAQHKEVRKEARRVLLRLEAARITPRWKPPQVPVSGLQAPVEQPPRFWKGVATLSRDQGQMTVDLLWEQGIDYRDVRILSFLLEFWHEGVKGVSAELITKRKVDERLQKQHLAMPDVSQTDCTLAEGKRLLEEALSINDWIGHHPHPDYRTYFSLINKLILQVPDSELGVDRGKSFITPDLTAQETVVNFIGAWCFGDFGLTYDLLTPGSAARDNLTKAEWIALHRSWYQEAHPTRMELGFVHEKPVTQSALWLPSSISKLSPTSKEIEVGWSIELVETPLSGTLKEMPLATAINKDTGRHWFWTSYKLVQEADGWRIQDIRDESLALQSLSADEIQQRISEAEKAIDELVKEGENNPQQLVSEAPWRLTQLLHLYDALIAKLPLDFQVNMSAYDRAVVVGNVERIAVYLERLTQRFQENLSRNLLALGATLIGLSGTYDPLKMQERITHLQHKAETCLQESLNLEATSTAHLMFGEFYLSIDRIDEGEQHLLTALTLNPGPEEKAAIEAGLGNIAVHRQQYDKAIQNYQNVIALDENYPGIWFNIGYAYNALERKEEAERSYLTALNKDDQDFRIYSELAGFYLNGGKPGQARAIMEKATQAMPEFAPVHALYASVLASAGDLRAAQRALSLAEEIDANDEIVQQVRQQIQQVARQK